MARRQRRHPRPGLPAGPLPRGAWSGVCGRALGPRVNAAVGIGLGVLRSDWCFISSIHIHDIFDVQLWCGLLTGWLISIHGPRECVGAWQYNVAAGGLLGFFLLSLAMELAVCIVGMRGSLFETSKRAALPKLLYADAAAFVGQIAFNGVLGRRAWWLRGNAGMACRDAWC